MNFNRESLFATIFILSVLASCKNNTETKEGSPLTEDQKRMYENAVRGLKTRDGLETTLFAHEPMLTNPTNMDIDARGRVWITEAYNYRNQVNTKNPYKKEGDRIVIMEDTNGDGVADTSKVFYQDSTINAALGIAVLGNKVIVSCSPNVFVFTDTNGDDRPDSKELLFRGIGGEQHDHAIHAFSFGPDGKYYFNFGNAGDSILDKNGNVIKDPYGRAVNNSGRPYRQGMVFRCDPDGSNLEVLAHNFRNNYEVAVDAFGTLWQSDNDDDGNRGVRINYVMEYGNYGYTDEMTGAGWQERRVNLEDSIPLQHWHLNDPGTMPNLLQTGSGSPTGMLVYEGQLLPAVFRNQMIHAEAGHNVVRSYPVAKSGAGYTATIENIVEGVNDQWFRPSDVCIAPDGSLFIADWYDPGVGGHAVDDLDRGRVFRVAPTGSPYKVSPLQLNSAEDAVKALENPNNATRYLAWTYLHGMGEQATPALEKMFTSENPRLRARALWLLSKIPGKGEPYIDKALTDSDEDVRIAAIRARRQLPGDIIPFIKKLQNDPSAQIRRELLVAIHRSGSPEVPAIWSALASRYDGKDRWYLEALGVGADGNWDSCFSVWSRQNPDAWKTGPGRDIVWRARAHAALPLLANIIQDPTVDPTKNLKYFRAFDFHSGPVREMVLLSLLQGNHPQQGFIDALAFIQMKGDKITPAMKPAMDKALAAVKGRDEFIDLVQKYKLKGQQDELLQLALHGKTEDSRGYAMKTLLATGGAELAKKQFSGDSTTAKVLLNAMGRNEDKETKDLLQSVAMDKQYQESVRKEALRMLSRGWNGFERVWVLVENKTLPAELSETAKEELLNAWRSDIRIKAEAYYNGNSQAAVLPAVAQLVGFKGDPGKGKETYTAYCATCHQVKKEGTNFGPALSEIGSKLSKDALYNAIIHPDAGISFGYEGYVFNLKDGSSVVGYVASETKEEVEIKSPGGTISKQKKANIISKKGYGHSLMPTGLAETIGKDKLVDLVEWLSTLKK